MRQISLCLFVGIMSTAISACVLLSKKQQNRVCFSSGCVGVEVVSRGEELMRGLQFRKSLAKDRGMLFIFPEESLRQFWMKDTQIPLDIIWFDSQENVIFIETNVPVCLQDPCQTYGPQQKSRYVLEVNAGQAKELGIEIGSKADFTVHP